MKNKNTTNSNTTSTTSTYKTINGIQKLPTGKYRVRKTINGTKYSGNFAKRTEAIKYLTLLTNAAKTA
jgi:hypothetical protein